MSSSPSICRGGAVVANTSVGNTSVGKMLVGGIVPGYMMGLGLMLFR